MRTAIYVSFCHKWMVTLHVLLGRQMVWCWSVENCPQLDEMKNLLPGYDVSFSHVLGAVTPQMQ